MTCARTHPSERRGMPSAMGRANPVVYIHVRTYHASKSPWRACLLDRRARARALLVHSGRLALRRGLRAPNGPYILNPYIRTLSSETQRRRRSRALCFYRDVSAWKFAAKSPSIVTRVFFGARKCGGNAGGIKKVTPRAARGRPLAAAALHPRVRHTVPRSRSTPTRPAARPCPTRRRARERARARAPRGLPRWTRAPVVRPAASCACT